MDIGAARAYLEEASKREQKLGHYDCVRFAVEMLYYGFGRDYRDKMGYWDRKSAVRRLRKAGGLRAAFSEQLGPEIPGDELEPGDIAIYSDPDTVGIVLPSCVAIFRGNQIHAFDRSTALSGWSTK